MNFANRDLWPQGDFLIYRRGAQQLDVPWQSLGRFPEGALVGRLRAREVEIEFSLEEIDAARVTFVDPERVLPGYIADLASDPNYKPEVWTVACGYHFAPFSYETWAVFSGVPLMENAVFESDRPPEVTISLLDGSVALQRYNSSQQGVKSRHWLYPPNEPPSVKKALQEMATFYDCSLDLGSLEPIITTFDEQMALYWEDPTGYITKEFSQGPTWQVPHVIAVRLADYIHAMRVFHNVLGANYKDRTDWEYLKWLAHALQPLVDKHFEGEKTGGISDVFWSKVSKAGNLIVYGIRDSKLYFQRLRDFLADRLELITVYSYQMDDCSLLSFRPQIRAVGEGTQALGLISRLVAKRMTSDEAAIVPDPSTTVLLSGMDAEMRVDAQVSDPEAGDALVISGRRMFRYVPASHTKSYADAPVKEVLGFLATNMRATAVVMGSPWLRAGMLVGTRGLGPGPENKPEPGQPPRISSYDRVWLVTRAVHRVDETGRYVTELELVGASTDDSRGKTEQEKMAFVFRDLVNAISKQPVGLSTGSERLIELLKNLGL